MNTIVVLFLDEIKILFLPKSADIYVEAIMVYCLITFLLEFVLSCIVNEYYAFSFFFYLDFISICFLITDISLLLFLYRLNEKDLFAFPHTATSFSDIAHVSKAAKIGSRVGRIMKLLKIVKIMQIARLYK